MSAKKRFLVVGAGGRECAFAMRLAADAIVYAVMPHENPLMSEYVAESGGRYVLGDPSDPQTVLAFAEQNSIDYAFINSDEPLANGVVDVLLDKKFKAIGGTKAATRIEWDKIYSIDMVNRLCPQNTPLYKIATSKDELVDVVDEFEKMGLQLAVKPRGLTGGKGVKVMPEHLPKYEDCITYGSSLLEKNPSEGVLLVERLEGIEFTIMGITDGTSLAMCPATYDYPFRNEGDTGPGTGGMGCFTNNGDRLPFLTDSDMNACRNIMQKIIDALREDGTRLVGVLNGGFFKTTHGIKFMEFNGRFGDPEVLNILKILGGSFSELLINLWNGMLSDHTIQFEKKASVVKYMVAPEYPDASAEAVEFYMDVAAISRMGIDVIPASCIKTGKDTYRTLKRSRVVALVTMSDDVDEASTRINKAVTRHISGKLEYRQDIGSAKSLAELDRINHAM